MKTLHQYARFAALPLAIILPLAVRAQVATPPQNAEPGITRQQADEIVNELRQIRLILEKQQVKAANDKAEPTPKQVKLSLQGLQVLGSKDAPLTMVEFTDYQCPFCQRFYKDIFGDIKKNYIDTGKLRFYSRDMPLDFHPNAMRAAHAARCAADQGQFWKMRDAMAADPGKLDFANLVADAGNLKLDVPTFRTCVESEKHKNEIQTDLMEAMKIGVEGTPSFVIGKSTPDGVDGVVVEGALPFPMFDEKFKALESK